MKRILCSFLLCTQGFSSISSAFADSDTAISKKFIVTAYYSPLPNQSFYLKGSYEADLWLNGNGTHGASGKPVYPGMLAGPKTYAFGTKIHLDGLGVGSVDDRGGAIVSSGSRGYTADRLDIWMGEGEEGLRRALTWGKRTVNGKILAKEEAGQYGSIELEKFTIGKINTASYKKSSISSNILSSTPQAAVNTKNDIFTQTVYRNSDPAVIKELQWILHNLLYYTGDIDGKYSPSLEDALYSFQIENGLVASKKTFGAGYYGPKTRTKLHEVYLRYQENERRKKEEEVRLAQEKAKQETLLAEQKKEAANLVASFGNPKEQEVGAHVRKLQLALKALGYFSLKDTAIFGKATKEALAQYQIDRMIVTPSDRSEAGMLGERTKTALMEDIMKLREKEGKTLAWNN